MTYYLNAFSLMSTTWAIEDALVYVLAIGVLFYFMKTRKDTAPYILLEMIAVIIYMSVFENYAVTSLHLYSYGPSLIMIGNVPLSIPVIESLVVIGSLALLDYMRIPAWCKPFVVGLFAILQDLSLDPLAVSQVASVGGSLSARWQWLIVQPGMPSLFNEPIFNWSGWLNLTLWPAIFFLIGRWWFKKSSFNPVVGAIYPFLAIVAMMAAMASPASQLLIWGWPIFAQGSVGEWIMLAVNLLFPLALLIIFWRGRMLSPLSLRDTWPIVGIFVFLHASDIVFMLIGGHTNVFGIVLLSTIVHVALLTVIYVQGKNARAHPA